MGVGSSYMPRERSRANVGPEGLGLQTLECPWPCNCKPCKRPNPACHGVGRAAQGVGGTTQWIGGAAYGVGGATVRDPAVGSDRGMRYPTGQFRWAGKTLVACSGMSSAGGEANAHRQRATPIPAGTDVFVVLGRVPRRPTLSSSSDQIQVGGHPSCVQIDDGARDLRAASQY